MKNLFNRKLNNQFVNYKQIKQFPLCKANINNFLKLN